jgi:hypothetical protein
LADTHLDGMDPHWVTVVQFKPRNNAGEVELAEADIVARVRRDLSTDANAVAVLHTVCGSKTGLVHPSNDTVAALVAEFRDRLIVVVDACQLRCDLQHVARYAQQGYLVLVTASKFFTAPPFAGAVVLPPRIVLEIETHLSTTQTSQNRVVPTGLRQYLTGFEVPASMPQLRAFLSEDNDWVNLGLHLRWCCGVNLMERYSALSRDAVETFTVKWMARVKELVERQAPYLRVLPEHTVQGDSGTVAMHGDMVGAVSGIVSIVVSVVDSDAVDEARAASSAFSGFKHLIKLTSHTTATPAKSMPFTPMRALNFDECKVFHRLLTEESEVGTATELSLRCMLGQPVKLADNGFAVVRIALGADMVVRALEGANCSAQIEDILREDDAVVSKMAGLARSWHTTGRAAVATVGDASALMGEIDQQLLLSGDASAERSTINDSAVHVLTAATVSSVLQEAYPATSRIPDVCVLYDLDAFDHSCHALTTAFASSLPTGLTFNHCFAVKSAPLTYLLRHAVQRGLGLETASIVEVNSYEYIVCNRIYSTSKARYVL